MGDYTNTTDLKTYCGIRSSDHDTILDGIVTAVTKVIDNYTGRKFNVTTNSTRTFREWDEFSGADFLDNPFDGDVLWLDEELAAQVSASDITGSPSVHYIPENEPPYYALILGSDTSEWSNPTSITGPWGYSTDIPSDIANAALVLGKHIYESREATEGPQMIVTPDGHVLMPKGIPNDVAMILDKYRKATVYS